MIRISASDWFNFRRQLLCGLLLVDTTRPGPAQLGQEGETRAGARDKV